jgi:hypothetical protein
MVILKGYVRSGEGSTEYVEAMVTSAAIIQGSAVVYSSSNGTFYTSANTTLDYVTCGSPRHKTVDYSVPVFATRYDPEGVVSGALTVNADITTYSGATVITDTSKSFMSGTLIGRVLEMRSGVYDGHTGAINQNTVNSVKLGGGWITSGGETGVVIMGGETGVGARRNDVWLTINNGANWTQVVASADWTSRTNFNVVTMPDNSVVIAGGTDGANLNDVWRSVDGGVTWAEMTAAAGWAARTVFSTVAMADGSIVLMGGLAPGFKNDVWHSLDNGATWHQHITGVPWWTARYLNRCVVNPVDNSIILMGGSSAAGLQNDVWRSTDSGETWVEMTAAAAWTARVGHTCVSMADGSIVLMGGTDGVNQNDVWHSLDNGATWHQHVTGAPWWVARSGHLSKLLPDGTIILMGGSIGASLLNDVWRSTDKGETWIQMTASAEWNKRWNFGCAMGGGVAISGYVVIDAAAGDIYNIGGVSNEPTTHIEFTLWDNSAYGGQGI